MSGLNSMTTSSYMIPSNVFPNIMINGKDKIYESEKYIFLPTKGSSQYVEYSRSQHENIRKHGKGYLKIMTHLFSKFCLSFRGSLLYIFYFDRCSLLGFHSRTRNNLAVFIYIFLIHTPQSHRVQSYNPYWQSGVKITHNPRAVS